MIRILMKIKHVSPFLKTVSGNVQVHYFNNAISINNSKLIFSCDYYIKPGVTGYNNITIGSTAIFHALKPQIDVMVHSYMNGLKIEKEDVSWIESSMDIKLDEWIKEKEKEYENSDENPEKYKKNKSL